MSHVLLTMHSLCSADQLTKRSRKAEKAMVKARASTLSRPEIMMAARPRPCQYLVAGGRKSTLGGNRWSHHVSMECMG